MLDPNFARQVKGVEYTTMSDLLKDFRRRIEQESGQPIEKLDTNAALFMRDLCVFLGMKPVLVEKVVGKNGVKFVNDLLGETVQETKRH